MEQTIILVSENKIFLFSEAVIKTAQLMKGFFPLLAVAKLVPSFVRDYIYRAVAKRRKKILKTSCDITKGKSPKNSNLNRNSEGENKKGNLTLD